MERSETDRFGKGFASALPILQRRMRPAVRKVQLRDAKTNLSMIVDDAIDGKPTVIMRRGKKQAVVLSYDEWLPLSKVPSIARLLMASPLRAGDIPPRDRARSRKTNF